MLAPNIAIGVAYWLFCNKCDFKNMITLSWSASLGDD